MGVFTTNNASLTRQAHVPVQDAENVVVPSHVQNEVFWQPSMFFKSFQDLPILLRATASSLSPVAFQFKTHHPQQLHHAETEHATSMFTSRFPLSVTGYGLMLLLRAHKRVSSI